MNLLVDKFSNVVNGVKIDTNFRVMILFEMLILDEKLSERDKIAQALLLFYDKETILNNDLNHLLDTIVELYQFGDSANSGGGGGSRVYSYEHDHQYIYSAFISQYNIDLSTVDMDWRKFKALFLSLNEEQKISKIMSYRATKITNKMNKEEKVFYKKMKQIYRLPIRKDEIKNTIEKMF